ncbi:MAG: hypothetical protein QNI95_08685 [Desulfobacterales bacterium]|nr:hypothetical protein [Desulfobacterales bacterium]
MTVKDLLKEFSESEETLKKRKREDEQKVRAKIELLLAKLNRCFVEVILPSVFHVENDLNQMGLWNQLNIGQTTSLASGKPNIKNVTLIFYPEKIQALADEARIMASAYKAQFIPSGDLRAITFSIEYPKRIPPLVEAKDETLPTEAIDKAKVDAFLEKFILNALDIYKSDRMLL